MDGQGLVFRRVCLLSHLYSPQGTQALGGQDLNPRSVVALEGGSADPQLALRSPGLMACLGQHLESVGWLGMEPGYGAHPFGSQERETNVGWPETGQLPLLFDTPGSVRGLTLFTLCFCRLSHKLPSVSAGTASKALRIPQLQSLVGRASMFGMAHGPPPHTLHQLWVIFHS